MKLRKQAGQSIVELVFAVILVVLFLTGSVMALIAAVSARGESLARKKAARLAELVMEETTGLKINNPDYFWQMIPESGEKTEFVGYTYSVNYSPVGGSADYPDCQVGLKNCVDVKVTVNWQRKTSNSLELKKFFGKGY